MNYKVILSEADMETIIDALKIYILEVERICMNQGWDNLEEYKKKVGAHLLAEDLQERLEKKRAADLQ